jgi:hypothetical protein
MKHTQQLIFRSLIDILGAIVLVGVSVILMLAYFDVLVK